MGVVLGSNEMGLTEAEVNALPEKVLRQKMTDVRNSMYAAGADYVIDSMTELPALIRAINERMNNL